MKRKSRLLIPFFISVLLIGSIGYGFWMWYDANVDRSGWKEQDGIRIYQDFYGDPVSGWLDLAGSRYYFDDGGIPQTGWQMLGGSTYYFEESGAMVTGWQVLDGKTYYFAGTGVMAEGWLALADGQYFLDRGVLTTGWKDIDGSRYYFDETGNMLRGFTDIEGNRYYLGDDGAMRTGTQTIEERIFCFGTDGIMQTGWQETGEGRRYYYSDGPMARGWTTISDTLYYFEEDGLMYTGWLTLGEYSYYLHEDGRAAIGPTEIDGQLHYFSPKGIEVILVNALNPVPDYYEISLKNIVSYHNVDARCFDALTQMLADCTAAGIKYTFNSAHRTISQQTEILELRTAEHMVTYELSYSDARQKALQTVAIPGTSEHHLGLAVDLLGEEAIAWFQEHCWDYGFIVRYTGEKYYATGIIAEPWHFRYVGVEVAQDIRASGLSLEEYLGAELVKPYAAPKPEPEPALEENQSSEAAQDAEFAEAVG